jgi:hypothetical protein
MGGRMLYELGNEMQGWQGFFATNLGPAASVLNGGLVVFGKYIP